VPSLSVPAHLDAAMGQAWLAGRRHMSAPVAAACPHLRHVESGMTAEQCAVVMIRLPC